MSRIYASFAMRELAARLVALESSGANHSEFGTFATCPVCEKLRRPLTALTGTAGFTSMMTRALTLAKRETSALNGVTVNADGSLEELHGDALQASPILIAHLLGLLAVFIGETLTMKLLHDIWPDITGVDLNSRGEELHESGR